MRLFVAIRPDEQVRQALVECQTRMLGQIRQPALHEGESITPDGVLRAPRSPWRATANEQLHMTLQFLGDEVTIHQQHEIEKALESVGAGGSPSGGAAGPGVAVAPFAMQCVGAGAFASAHRATVLWAGARSEEANGLAASVARALLPLGLTADRPFAPHVTLARTKYPQDVSAALSGKEGRMWSDLPWNVDRFALVCSDTVLGGHEHRVLKEYALG